MSIENTLKEMLVSVEYPTPKQPIVKLSYETTNETFTSPIIVIEELENHQFKKNAGGGTALTNLGYQIDIYSRGILYNDTPKNATDSVKALAETVRNTLDVAGLTRIDGRMLPYSTEVARYTMRFQCTLDSKGYFYAR